MNVNQIPSDVLKMIVLRYLDRSDILHLCETSKYFYNRLCNRRTTNLTPDQFNSIWKSLYERDISSHPPEIRDYYDAYQRAIQNVYQDDPTRMKDHVILPVLAMYGYETWFQNELETQNREPRGKFIKAVNAALYQAAENGRLDIIEYLVPSLRGNPINPISISNALNGAAQSGHLDIMKYLFSNRVPINNATMMMAAQGGHRDVIDYIIDTVGTDNIDFNISLYQAAKGCHPDIVYLFVNQYGATNFEGSLNGAAAGGCLPLIDYFIQQGATDYQGSIENAISNRYLDAADYIYERFNQPRLDGTELFHNLPLNYEGYSERALDWILNHVQEEEYDRLLALSSLNEKPDFVRKILKTGDITDIDTALATVIHIPSEQAKEIVEMLLSLRPSYKPFRPRYEDLDEESLFEIAETRGLIGEDEEEFDVRQKLEEDDRQRGLRPYYD